MVTEHSTAVQMENGILELLQRRRFSMNDFSFNTHLVLFHTQSYCMILEEKILHSEVWGSINFF